MLQFRKAKQSQNQSVETGRHEEVQRGNYAVKEGGAQC